VRTACVHRKMVRKRSAAKEITSAEELTSTEKIAMVLVLLVLLVTLGIEVTNVGAFFPISLLNALHLPQWIGWGFAAGAIAWIVGDR